MVLKINNKFLKARVIAALGEVALAFRKRKNSAEIASDALSIVSYKYAVKRLPGLPLWREGGRGFPSYKDRALQIVILHWQVTLQ